MKKVFIPILALLISLVSLSTCYAWKLISEDSNALFFTATADGQEECENTVEHISPQLVSHFPAQEAGADVAHAKLTKFRYNTENGQCNIRITIAGGEDKDELKEVRGRVKEFILQHAPVPQ